MKEKYSVLVVGSGITGAVFAERAAEKGLSALVIDRREHIAGNCYDYSENGITIHKYGPHVFHTNSEAVWRYLSKFTKWHHYIHKVFADIDGLLAPLPFNLNSMDMFFPAQDAANFEKKLKDTYGRGSKVPITELLTGTDADLRRLAGYVYEKVFRHYTAKQWGVPPEEVPGGVTARVPVFISRDDRYFTDRFQGIPAGGYTAMIRNMLDNPLIDVELSTGYKDIAGKVECDTLVYTGSIDGFFNHRHGVLPYRSAGFELETVNMERYQPAAVVNYPNNHDFTRITEFKYFLDEKSGKSVIMREFPANFEKGKNEPLYPVATPENIALYEKYLAEAGVKNKGGGEYNVIFAGRLGEYKYYDMDAAVECALAASDELWR